MFSYSSIEHMGLITFAFGMGSPLANFAGLLHMTVHSLVKSAIFFTVGHATQKAGTQVMSEIRGLIKVNPIATWSDLDVQDYIEQHDIECLAIERGEGFLAVGGFDDAHVERAQEQRNHLTVDRVIVDDQQAQVLVLQRRTGLILVHRHAFADNAMLRRRFARLVKEEEGGDSGARTDTSSDGSFSLICLRRGSYSISVSPQKDGEPNVRPTEVAGLAVEGFDDLEDGGNGLPPTDGVRLHLAQATRAIVRPSRRNWQNGG